MPESDMALVHSFPCPVAFGLPTRCNMRHSPPRQITCQRNSVLFSGCHLLFSISQAAEAHTRKQQRPYRWEKVCDQVPSLKYHPLCCPDHALGEATGGTGLTEHYNACQQEVLQQHSEGSAAEQELEDESDHVHS